MGRVFVDGFMGAIHLFLLLFVGCLMFPLFVVGIVAGIAWVGFRAGMIFAEETVLDWLTADLPSTWRVRFEQPAAREQEPGVTHGTP